MLNAILKAFAGGTPPASSPAPTPPPAATQPPAPVPAPTPVDAPATVPAFSNDAPSGSVPEASPPATAGQPAALEPPAAGTPAPSAQATDPEPPAAPASPPAGRTASEAPQWHSVPLSFRPEPSIRADDGTERARAIEVQRQLWVASIVERVGTPAARPTLLADEAPDARPEPGKPEAG